MMPPNSSDMPGPETISWHRTANGITLLVYPTPHTRSVVLSGSLAVGAIHEDPLTHGGLASMTAASLLLGTESRDFDTLHNTLEDLSADLTLGGGMHRTSLGGKALAEDLPVLIDLLADALRRPAFPQDHIERLRGERLTAFNYLFQDTQWLAGRAFRQALYPAQHAYHYGTRGTPESLTTLTLDDLRGFHRRHYRPQGMVLALAGSVQPEAVRDLVERHLGDWGGNAPTPDAPLPPAPAPDGLRRETIRVPGKAQADLMLGTVGPSRFAPDFMAANLANSVLGVFGMMGRVGDIVREREGMAYFVGSRLDGGFGPGAWRISAGVEPANVERAIDLCRGEIRRLVRQPVSDDELGDNQSHFVGRLPLHLENNEGIAATLHAMQIYDLGLDYLTRYRERVMAISAEDVQQAATRYLDPDRLVISVAGDLDAN